MERVMYELDRHRYLELKHFCLQYGRFKELYLKLEHLGDSVSSIAAVRTDCWRSMELIETTAYNTDLELGYYIFRSVTEDVSYKELGCANLDGYRRKFFWLLHLAK